MCIFDNRLVGRTHAILVWLEVIGVVYVQKTMCIIIVSLFREIDISYLS